MQFDTYTNIILALIIVLVVGLVYHFFYLKKLGSDLDNLAFKLDFEITKRSDLLPLLLENIGHFLSRESYLEILQARAATMSLKAGQKGKTLLENQLWQKVDSSLNEVKDEEALKNIHLASFRTAFEEASEKVNIARQAFNEKLKKFNIWGKVPGMKLFSNLRKYYLMEEF